MSNRVPLVAGNWKMNGSRKSVDQLVTGLLAQGPFSCEVLVLPPFVFLEQVRQCLGESDVALGAQNVDWHESGAFTGEISASMLAEAGCSYCLVGHSERRSLFRESDAVVADKFAVCLEHGIKPVLCVGETLVERQGKATLAIVTRQIRAVVDRVGIDGFADAVIAYEPVWAIGTGESATPAQAEEVHTGIRDYMEAQDVVIGAEVRLLYGGSVTPENASGLLGQRNIDGALVGGASLKADAFAAICRGINGQN